jgi:predicted lipid-binding transport protein (Tim44 family)
MHAIVLKVAASMGGAVTPGLVAGVIYLVIALATGASAVASVIGGILVAAIAVTIGLIIRAFYERRALGSHR